MKTINQQQSQERSEPCNGSCEICDCTKKNNHGYFR